MGLWSPRITRREWRRIASVIALIFLSVSLKTFFKEGITIWGWVDMPSYTYDFVTCDDSLGDTVYYYDFTEEIGSIRPDILNFPGLYIDYGDLVATEGAIVNDPGSEFVIELGFRNED